VPNRARGLALVLIVAGLVAGCGGSDDPPSQADYAKAADKICADVETRVTALGKSNPRSAAELQRYIESLKQASEDGVKRLRALDTPEGAAGKTADQFTGTLERQYRDEVVPALDQLRQAVTDGDKKALRAATKQLNAIDNKQTNQLASELGAKGCAEP
jgi:hypothetical protein